MGINFLNCSQYDPEGKKRRNLYYHFIDEHKPDKLIAKIRKADAHAVSFRVSNDFNYLLLRGSRTLSIANIKCFEREVKFDLIFKMSEDFIYVSYTKIQLKPFSLEKNLLYSKQEYVGNDGEYFIFLTNFRAPKHHLVEINIRNKINIWNVDVIVPVSEFYFLNQNNFVLKYKY